MRSIKEILMARGSMSEKAADKLIAYALKDLQYLLKRGNIEEAESICETWFGLEPDCLDDLLI